ncbi:MAG: peptide chain release factor N(5)-glutamine methyltransferase [Ruminiclostridium sp.]|nr:peptide chain release factor N(5)-glutamine methyltransferase [Ruminiclostridium sp.]
MTIREALVNGTRILNNEKIEAPAVDAGVILCHVLECDRSWLYAHGAENLDTGASEKYSLLLFKRCSGMPVQYITGKQEFMGLDFHVNRNVLIPRPETEILAETVIELGKKSTRTLKVLEIGTGSGCIAVSIAYYLRNSFIMAADISEKALEIARMNTLKHGVSGRIEYIRSNIFDKIVMSGFDIIVSNPPYAKHMEIPGLQREVRDFEPELALDGGEDGLGFYRPIIGKAPEFLKENGNLAFEVGIHQAKEVVRLMKSSFSAINIKKDLAGIERVVLGRLIGSF